MSRFSAFGCCNCYLAKMYRKIYMYRIQLSYGGEMRNSNLKTLVSAYLKLLRNCTERLIYEPIHISKDGFMKTAKNQKNRIRKTNCREKRRNLSPIKAFTLSMSILIHVLWMNSAFADETLLDSFSSDKKFQEDIYIEIKPNSVWNKEPLKTIRDFLNRLAETMTCSMIPIFLALIILKYLIGETHSKTQVASRIWRGKGGHNK